MRRFMREKIPTDQISDGIHSRKSRLESGVHTDKTLFIQGDPSIFFCQTLGIGIPADGQKHLFRLDFKRRLSF
ncbi:hypothetical protein ES703_12039 [subsurface metagenome]